MKGVDKSMITKQMEDMVDWMPEETKHSYHRFKRTMEILTTDPEPEVGLTPKEVIWTKKQNNVISLYFRKAKEIQNTFTNDICIN